jgi:ribosomal protein L29
MTGAEAKALRDEEIGIELKRLREKLFTLRSQAVTEKVEDTSQFLKVRKDIARLLTERNTRRLAKNPRPARKSRRQRAAGAAGA